MPAYNLIELIGELEAYLVCTFIAPLIAAEPYSTEAAPLSTSICSTSSIETKFQAGRPASARNIGISSKSNITRLPMPELKPLPPRICGSLSTMANPATPLSALSKVVTLFLTKLSTPTTSIVCMEVLPSRFNRSPRIFTSCISCARVSSPTFSTFTSSPLENCTFTFLS